MSANAPEYIPNPVYYDATKRNIMHPSQQYHHTQPQQNNMQPGQQYYPNQPQQTNMQPGAGQYYSTQPQKTNMQHGQTGQYQQQVYMQSGQLQLGQKIVYGQQGQQYFLNVAAPIQDTTEKVAFTLLIIGMCVPFVWLINACMYMKSLNPITKKYAKISLGLGLIQLLFIIAYLFAVYYVYKINTSYTRYYYY